MAGILTQASVMADYIVQAAASVLRLGQAIATFNYQLLSTVFRTVYEGCRAVFTVCIVLGTACADVVVYLADFCAEIFRFLLQLSSFAGKLGLVFFEGLCYLGSLLEQATAYVAGALVQSLQILTSFLSRLLPCCNIVTQYIKNGAELIYGSICGVVGSVIHGASYVVLSAVLQVVNLTNYVCECVKHSIVYVLTLIWENILAISSSISFLVHFTITKIYDIRASIAEETLYLVLVIAFLNVLMISIVFPLMRKQGLTFPLPWRYTPNQGDNGLPLGINLGIDDDELSISSASGSEGHGIGTDFEDQSEQEEGESEEEEEDGESSEEAVEEFEVASDTDSDSEGDENDPNAINVELPRTAGRYSLRARPSPSPMPGCSKLSSRELEKTLESERDKRLCVVCQDQVKSVLVLPCKHMCLCIDCAHAIAASRRPRRICPLCRGRIQTIMNVYV